MAHYFEQMLLLFQELISLRKGLFKAIISEVFRRALLSGRRYIVTSTSDALLNTYLKIGFQTVGLSYDHPDLSLTPHSIIFMDIKHPLTGWGIAPQIWRRYYGRRSLSAPNKWHRNLSFSHRSCLTFQVLCAWFREKSRLQSWKHEEIH